MEIAMTINAHQTTWYKVHPRTHWGAGVKIGACIIAIGLFYAVAQCSQQYVAVMPTDPEAVVAVDNLKREYGPTKLQAAIDTTPVFEDVSTAFAIKPDIPASAIPSKKPVLAAQRTAARAYIKNADMVKKMPSDVRRFDHCKPKCETRDPLIVAYTPPRQYAEEAPLIASGEKEAGFNLSPMQGARYILARTADAPRAALRTGRDVIESFVRPD
jgi:hypothetical protein